jgi:sugar phosphate isomerase/epimerase
MKLALTVRYGYDEELIFAQQLGADSVVVRFDLGDPQDTDLSPVVHRVQMVGMQLAGVELFGMADEFQPWSNGLTGALLAAQDAGVTTLLCASPIRRSATLAVDLEAVGATAATTGVCVCLDSSCLLAEELAWLPAGDVHVELALGLAPLEAGDSLAAEAADRVSAGGVSSVRFDGGGKPLADGALNVPACFKALATAGYDGLVRAGSAPLLAEDDDWNPKGAANDLGYLRATLQTLRSRGLTSCL